MSHNPVAHKVMHNLTTLANIPLAAWLIYTIFTLRYASYDGFAAYMAHPLNMAVAIIFIMTTLKHFSLELAVVFEDYIAKKCLQKAVIQAMNVFFFVLGVVAIVSVLKLGL